MSVLVDAKEKALLLLAALPDLSQMLVATDARAQAWHLAALERSLLWLVEAVEEALAEVEHPAAQPTYERGLAMLYGAWRGVELSVDDIGAARIKSATPVDECSTS